MKCLTSSPIVEPEKKISSKYLLQKYHKETSEKSSLQPSLQQLAIKHAKNILEPKRHSMNLEANKKHIQTR